MSKYKEERENWIIMSKDRKHVAVGQARNRYIAPVGETGNHRLLTYNSEGKARAGFSNSNGFYGMSQLTGYQRNRYEDNLAEILEPVKVKITIKEV